MWSGNSEVLSEACGPHGDSSEKYSHIFSSPSVPTVASITYLKRDLESIGPREVVHWLRVCASRGPGLLPRSQMMSQNCVTPVLGI